MPDWDKALKKRQPKPAPSKEAISKGYAFPKCIENVNTCLNLRKLVDLLETPISRGDVGRQLQLLDDFLDKSSYAFWLRDIPFIIRLFEAIVIKNKTAQRFKAQLKRLFGLAAVPPMLVKPSEQLEYRSDFQHYFSVLGYLVVCIRDHEAKHLVLNAIKALLIRDQPVGYCCVSWEYCKEAATESQLPEIVGQLLEVICENLYEKLLEIGIALAESSKEACNRMIDEHAVEFVLQRLEPHWKERDHTMRPVLPLKREDIGEIMHCEDSMRLLWLFLKSMVKGTDDLKPSLYALWSLHYAFRTSVLNAGQRIDRNNLAAIILKLLQLYENIDIEETDIAYDVGLLSVASEITTKGTWVCPIHFSNDDKDFIFKKILMSTIPSLLKHGALQSFKRFDLVGGLILVLKKRSTISWHTDQHCELDMLAAQVLSSLVSRVVENIGAKRIIKSILEFLQEFTRNRCDSRILLSYLRCFRRVLPVIAFTYIRDMNGFNIVLLLTKTILEGSGNNYMPTMMERCLAYCFYLLEQLHAKDTEKDTSSGVDLCLYMLKAINDPEHSLIHPRVTVCALHFLWDILEGSPANINYMIKQGGLYSLLDVIVASSEQLSLPALGALVQACTKRACIPYLITWRKQGKRIMSLLMQLFRGSTEAVCTISNHAQFASEKINYLMNMCHQRNMNPPQVAEGQFVDLYRSKVFCILKVFSKYRRDVELADESYRLFNEKLTFEDQITKMVAQNFLSLKLCDAWLDLDVVVKQDSFLLVAEDRANLDDVTSLAKKWKWHLKRLLEEQYELYKFKDRKDEVMFYHRLNNSTVAEAFDALKELKRIACGTERTFMLTKRIRKAMDLDMMSYKTTEDNYHKTEPMCLPIAHVFDQVVEIESNKIHKEREVIDFDSVSSDEDVSPGYDSDRDCLSTDDVLRCIDRMD